MGSITEKLSIQMTRDSSILPESGTLFTHEWDEEMHVKSLSQGLNFDLAQPGLEPGTFLIHEAQLVDTACFSATTAISNEFGGGEGGTNYEI